MATVIQTAMVDHSALDNTGAKITGSQVDENPTTLAQILDGTSTTTLNGAASPGMNWTNLPYTIDHKASRLKVYNDSTATSIADGEILYVSGYNSTNTLYTVAKAVVTTANATTLYGTLVADGAISTSTSGYAVKTKVLTAQNTNGLTVGRPLFLSTTAGGYTGTLPSAEYRIQIVGFVATADSSTGRAVLQPGQIIPYDLADTI